MDHESHDTRPPGFWRSRFGLGWLVLAGVAGWFLWQEHRAHLFGAAALDRDRRGIGRLAFRVAEPLAEGGRPADDVTAQVGDGVVGAGGRVVGLVVADAVEDGREGVQDAAGLFGGGRGFGVHVFDGMAARSGRA